MQVYKGTPPQAVSTDETIQNEQLEVIDESHCFVYCVKEHNAKPLIYQFIYPFHLSL